MRDALLELAARVAAGDAYFDSLLQYLSTQSPRLFDARLLFELRAELSDARFADDLLRLEHTVWPADARRPARAVEVGIAEFDASGRCSDWARVVADAYKVGRVLSSYYIDVERHFYTTLPNGEDVERAAFDAVQSSAISLAAQIPFAIRLHRLWTARDGDGLARLLDETTAASSSTRSLHNERVHVGRLAVRCVELEHNAHSALYTMLLRSDLAVLHECVAEAVGVANGYEWILEAWIDCAARALFAWDWVAHGTPPAAMLMSDGPGGTTPLSLRRQLQEQVRAIAVVNSRTAARCPPPALSHDELHRRLLAKTVVTEPEWREWRAYDKDVLCEFIDAVLAQIVHERSTMPARSPSSPLTSPGAFEHSPSLLLRTYHAASAMGPTIALLLDVWVDHVLPLRLQAMAQARPSIAWPARCPPPCDEPAGIALGMLSRRSGVLKLHYLERLLRAGRRNRISVHFVLLVVRDVARVGRHPIASLEPDDRVATATYRAFMDGDFSSVSVQRAIHATVACDDMTCEPRAQSAQGDDGEASAVTIAFGSLDGRERLHRLAVVLPPAFDGAHAASPQAAADWRTALQVWSALDYAEPGSEAGDRDWCDHVVHPALSAWRDARDVPQEHDRAASAAAAAAAAVDHATEMLDGPTRVAYDDLAARIADMQRALSQTVSRDEVSYAIRTNDSSETGDADVNAIRAEPLLFKYFEAFCYRMNETYAGCMGKLSGQVKSNAGGHKVNFGALFNLLPDVFGVKAGVALVLAPAVIAMRMRSAGQACDFVRLASDPDEFARLTRAIAVRILSDDRKRRQLRFALARDEAQSISIRNLRASVRRMQRSRYDTTVSRFAVHDAQVLVDAVMDGDVDCDKVERLRRLGDIAPLANELTAIIIQRTVTNTEEQDGNNEGSKLAVVLQAAAGAAKPYAAAAPRAVASIVSKVL